MHRSLRARPDSGSAARRLLSRADIVIIGAPHSAYRDLRIPAEKIVVDIWNFWRAQPWSAGAEVAQQPRTESRGSDESTGHWLCRLYRGYLIEELLEAGYDVSAWTTSASMAAEKSYDTHPRYTSRRRRRKDVELIEGLLADCDHFVAAPR